MFIHHGFVYNYLRFILRDKLFILVNIMATYHMVGPRLHFTENGILPLLPIYTPTNLLNIPPNSMPNCMPGCLRAIFYVNSRQASGIIIDHYYLSDLRRNLPGIT